jgi:hypothetical protein
VPLAGKNDNRAIKVSRGGLVVGREGEGEEEEEEEEGDEAEVGRAEAGSTALENISASPRRGTDIGKERSRQKSSPTYPLPPTSPSYS